ncbi:MAG: DUF4296 domain-containing protein [Prolixibacteraceae bacterium]|nr:DUF4296 domain-containing protein [Prolixibacteraceae bacterium]
MKLHILIAIFLLVAVGCKRDPKPRETLNEKIFVDVLTDIHIAEGIYGERSRIPIDSLKSELLYEAVLIKHNVSEEEMVATTMYYSRHPREYDKIYDEVLSRLSAMLEGENSKKTIDIDKVE